VLAAPKVRRTSSQSSLPHCASMIISTTTTTKISSPLLTPYAPP